jgi:hypothetical protein
MKANWILEEDVFDENIEEFKKEINNQGMSYDLVNLKDFQSHNYNLFPGYSCVIFYGSLRFMRRLLREKNWIPCGWCTLANFECFKYYTYWGKHLFNQDYIMIPLQELIRRKEYIFENFGEDNKIFVRPSSGYKEFDGEVISLDGLNESMLSFVSEDSPELLVVVSSPKKIDREWRFVVTDTEVITGSMYKDNGSVEMELSKEGSPEWDYVRRLVEGAVWHPDKTYTMDVCESNGKKYLLELNAFSTSGFYDCDLKKIISTASEMAVTEHHDFIFAS